MRNFVRHFVFFTILAGCFTASDAQTGVSPNALLGSNTIKFTSYEFTTCEDEIALLDKFLTLIDARESGIGFVVVYGSKSKFSEAKVRVREIVRYLVEEKGLSRDQLIVFHGGSRKKIAVELWLSSSTLEFPFVSVPSSVNHKAKREEKDVSYSCKELF